jgi:hypothetical protein
MESYGHIAQSRVPTICSFPCGRSRLYSTIVQMGPVCTRHLWLATGRKERIVVLQNSQTLRRCPCTTSTLQLLVTSQLRPDLGLGGRIEFECERKGVDKITCIASTRVQHVLVGLGALYTSKPAPQPCAISSNQYSRYSPTIQRRVLIDGMSAVCREKLTHCINR